MDLCLRMIHANISIYFDTRRSNSEGNYPVKLRVYYRNETRYYPTGLQLTRDEFEQSYQAATPKGQKNKELKIKIQSIESKANDLKDTLGTFSFEKLEKKLFRPSGAAHNVFYFYSQVIKQLEMEDRLGTASNYNLSVKSFKKFLRFNNKKEDNLNFEDVTVTFLRDYEKWMLSQEKSMTTVGIYIRPLRAIFNVAIAEGELSNDSYPFGKRKYQIPGGRNIKKALSKADLQSTNYLKIAF